VTHINHPLVWFSSWPKLSQAFSHFEDCFCIISTAIIMKQDAKRLRALHARPPSVLLKVVGYTLNSIFMVIQVDLAIPVAVPSKPDYA
jgi:hypothetical protein